jgi:phenylacetate-CoA ligase
MSGVSEQIYLGSPIWLQQCAVAGYGWWWHRRRFGRHFSRLVAEFKHRERWTAQQFRAYQAAQLGIVLAAARRSPYYREVYDQSDVRQDMAPFEALRQMPLLTKEILRTNARKLLTESVLPKGTIIFKSSGTTGTPTDIFYTPEFHSLELAVPEARSLNWARVGYRDRRVMFGVRKVCRFEQDRPPFWRFSPSENLAYASIYHLSMKFLPDYVEFLRSYKPAIVMGYPSALNTIATYALETGNMPGAAKAVFTTSETVTEEARRRIEAAFQCHIYDRYCAVEMCVFASQCEHGRYHVSPEVGIIEIVDSRGKALPPGEMGEVICTGLRNTLQPLIRYRIGDAARWAIDQKCPCGRTMPILESVEGRFEDMCYTPDGRQILRFDTVFKGIEKIREAQVIQEKLDFFTINVVPCDGFRADDVAQIQHNMRLHVGNVETHVKSVLMIPRTLSGKFKAVVCKLSSQDRRRVDRLTVEKRDCEIESRTAIN